MNKNKIINGKVFQINNGLFIVVELDNLKVIYEKDYSFLSNKIQKKLFLEMIRIWSESQDPVSEIDDKTKQLEKEYREKLNEARRFGYDG